MFNSNLKCLQIKNYVIDKIDKKSHTVCYFYYSIFQFLKFILYFTSSSIELKLQLTVIDATLLKNDLKILNYCILKYKFSFKLFDCLI